MSGNCIYCSRFSDCSFMPITKYEFDSLSKTKHMVSTYLMGYQVFVEEKSKGYFCLDEIGGRLVLHGMMDFKSPFDYIRAIRMIMRWCLSDYFCLTYFKDNPAVTYLKRAGVRVLYETEDVIFMEVGYGT